MPYSSTAFSLSTILRQLIAWPVILLLPAFLFWPRNEWIQPTLVNWVSYFVVAFGLLMSQVTVSSLARFPGRQSALAVFPTISLWFAVALALLIPLRVKYSVFYIAGGFVLSCVYLYLAVFISQKSRQCMAYIPLGRTQNLPQVASVQWLALDTPQLPDVPVSAIVADLHTPNLSDEWQTFLAHCTLQRIPVFNVRQVEESLSGRVRIRQIYENDLGSLLPSSSYLLIKQVMDVCAVLVSLPITLPLMLLTALTIRLESPGRVIFTQSRVGQYGQQFKIYKFRSMCLDSEQGGARFASAEDDRVTRVGRFIRKVRLDELPQFWNILKGEMSLIGPRPEQKAFVDAFEQSIPFYTYRHIVKPGISGWAQVTQGYAADTDETQLKIEHDFYYIKHFSFSLDVLIFFKTIKTMLTGFGAR